MSECFDTAKTVCTLITDDCHKLFEFCKHLSAVQFISGDRFIEYNHTFPDAYVDEVVEAYPFINKEKLKSELKVLYERNDLQKGGGAIGSYKFLKRSGLEKCFSETCTILKIVLTTPMSTAEAERCFSTMKRIKTFLRNTMTDTRMNALAMLAVDKNLVPSIPDFNEKVIDVFQSLKERRADFSYKS